MICVILAAGYATRLYPLTENFPKPLLAVKGKPILDWLIEDIQATGAVDEYILISNHKYYHHFTKWAKTWENNIKITVLDDGTTGNDNRLGAVIDIQFAIETLSLNDDLLVIAGDNLLDFSFKHFTDYFLEKQATCVMRYFEPSLKKLNKCGVITLDKDDKIINMEEKPAKPKSNWVTPPFYIYERNDVPLVAQGIKAGCATDAPGSFIAWLSQKKTVYAMEMPGNRYDIGDLKSYERIKEIYGGMIK